MHTARSLTLSPSMLCSTGDARLVPGGACLIPGGLPGPEGGRGCLPGPGGGGIPACTEADPPPREQNSWHALL